MQTATPNSTRPAATKFDANTPLYPVPAASRSTGITMLDWLAAMAMQGIMAKGMKVTADRALSEDEKDNEMAERAYKMAAAMLRARANAL